MLNLAAISRSVDPVVLDGRALLAHIVHHRLEELHGSDEELP